MNSEQPSFKWPVYAEQAIAASSSSVWDAISMPGNLELCHPFCASNPVQEWPGPNSVDEVHYLSGWVYVRQFCNWIDGVGYDLNIGRKGGNQSFVYWRINEIDENNCTLRITVHPHALQKLPAAIRWLPHFAKLRPALQSYLDSVVKGFEWYVTRGAAVPRNQFGRHPWFSADR